MPRVAIGLNGNFLKQVVNPAPFLQFLGQKVVVEEARPLLSACNLPGRQPARRRAGAPGGGGGQGTRRPTVAKNLEIVVMTWRGRGRPHCRHIHDRCHPRLRRHGPGGALLGTVTSNVLVLSELQRGRSVRRSLGTRL